MKHTRVYLSLLAFVSCGLTSVLSTGHSYADPHLLERDDEHDRGIWVLDCKLALSACNNACFSINCRKVGGKLYYKKSANDENVNRFNGGCRGRTKNQQDKIGRSVCRTAPFSQLFSDSQGYVANADCDEWPPASMDQDRTRGDKPPSLRCMSDTENRSAGGQLGNFISGKGNQPKRKGEGPLKDGDFFTVEFINLGPKTPYCEANPKCDNDGQQFQLSDLKDGLPEPGSPNDYPWNYNYDEHNHYQVSAPHPKANVDIDHCQINVDQAFLDREQKTISARMTMFTYDGQIGGEVGFTPIKTSPEHIQITGLGNAFLADELWMGTEAKNPPDDKYAAMRAQLIYRHGTDPSGYPSEVWASDKLGAGGKYCNKIPEGDYKCTEYCWYGCWRR